VSIFHRATTLDIISASDLPKFEWLLDLIDKESDLDIKFLFFNKSDGKWRINIAAEIRNSRNHVGGVYTWSYNPDSKDEFARAVKSLLINIRGYYRFQDGDNRELPVKVDVQEKS
jgi:hypothetical protein